MQEEEPPVDYDTVAFALLNAFSLGEQDEEKDNSLAVPHTSHRFSSPSSTKTTRHLNQKKWTQSDSAGSTHYFIEWTDPTHQTPTLVLSFTTPSSLCSPTRATFKMTKKVSISRHRLRNTKLHCSLDLYHPRKHCKCRLLPDCLHHSRLSTRETNRPPSTQLFQLLNTRQRLSIPLLHWT